MTATSFTTGLPETVTFVLSVFAVPDYIVRFEPGSGDVFHPPAEWAGAFALVHECYTLQALPPDVREHAARSIAPLVAPGGRLLVIARARNEGEPPGTMPWPLTRSELMRFEELGLRVESFDDFLDNEDPPVRRFLAVFLRPSDST